MENATVIYNGNRVPVTVDRNEDGSVKLYRGEDRNYYSSEVIKVDDAEA